MADNASQRWTKQNSQQNDQDQEVRYWTRRLGCTNAQLAEGVKQIGSSVEKVREHFCKKTRLTIIVVKPTQADCVEALSRSAATLANI